MIGGGTERSEGPHVNTKCWKLRSETQFVEVTEIPHFVVTRGPSICYYDLRKLILTGGYSSDVCVILDTSTKKWKKMTNLKRQCRSHASECILQQLFIFGGTMSMRPPLEWSTTVEYLNIEQEHGVWQSAPGVPSALEYPKITKLDTNVYLMGDKNPVLYVFDVGKKSWREKAAVPQNPGKGFSIAAGNGSLYAVGGKREACLEACWTYIISTDSWTKLSSPALIHSYGTLIFHQNSLLLLGGQHDHIEGYAIDEDIWAVAPYNLPEKLYCHYAFMMDLGV